MRRWYAVALGLAVVTLLGVSPVRTRLGATPALAAASWDVTAGTDVEAELIETNAFLPSTLTIATGDTVSWRFAGFHTVTFLAGDPLPALIIPGPGPGELMAGPGFFPLPPGPMPPTGPYDGRQLVSSGTPQGDPADTPPFVLTFTTPGVYAYLCAVHVGMSGTVTVLPAGSALPETPAQATARGQAQFEAIQASIKNQAQPVQSASAATRGGVNARTVDVGLNTPAGASKLAFLPGDLTVRRGDVVAWVIADTFNIHTVTFTSGGPQPEFGDVVPRPDGPPQVIFRANVAGPTGGTTYSGQGYVNSGIMLPGQSFAMTIDAPAGTYTYVCLIHGSDSGGMRGTITVTE